MLKEVILLQKSQLKELVCKQIDTHADSIISYVESISTEAELGYKEHKTAAKVSRFFQEQGMNYRDGLAITGIKSTIGDGDVNIAVIGELDAVICNDHPLADCQTGAAHACGHNLQIGAMLAAAVGLNQPEILKALSGKITFMAVPAEEYVEITYRNRLRAEGKIKYLGGKQELIHLGEFDDIDLSMMVHSQKDAPKDYIAIGKSSNGFIGKSIQYIGKVAHAGEAPESGVNALNAAMLGLMGIHSLRETFRDQDSIRFHPIITKGGDLVNSVPADIRIESYIRAKTMNAIDQTNDKIDQALKAGAMAIGAQAIIETTPGYLPLVSEINMNDLFVANTKEIVPNVEVVEVEHFGGSTDIGDVSHIMPTIQPFVGGTSGLLHSKDFHSVDYHKSVLTPAKAMAMTVIDLLFDQAALAKKIKSEFRPVFTKQEYLDKLDSYFSKK